MDKKQITIYCGGTYVNYDLLYENTIKYFYGYIETRYVEHSLNIQITPEYMQENKWLVSGEDVPDALLEYHCLMLATGTKILADHRALFHGAALFWNDLAWIITAPSGTGKTTQLRHWIKILGHDARTINGDKPFLACHDDGTVWVYSSPWKGKEGYGHPGMCAKLGGIIFLEQGLDNSISRMSKQDAVLPLLTEFISTWDNTDIIKDEAFVLNTMLNAIPVWKLVNIGDEASAQITIDAISEYLKNMDKIEPGEMVAVKANPDSQWHMRDGVILVQIQGEYLLLGDDAAVKKCNWIRKINELATFIWKQMTEDKSYEEIIASIREEYEVPGDCDLGKDVNTFLQELKDNNYLV